MPKLFFTLKESWRIGKGDDSALLKYFEFDRDIARGEICYGIVDTRFFPQRYSRATK